MEKEKLTLADAMKYPNAEILEVQQLEGTYFNAKKYKDIAEFCEKNSNDIRGFRYNEIIKTHCLILRSINELTEEEKEYIADNFLITKHFWDTRDRTFQNIINHCKTFKITNLIDHLRSIRIDIDGYLLNGKAVKK